MKIRGNTVGTPIKPEQAILRCKDLTEEQKAQARQNIGLSALEQPEWGTGEAVEMNTTLVWDNMEYGGHMHVKMSRVEYLAMMEGSYFSASAWHYNDAAGDFYPEDLTKENFV